MEVTRDGSVFRIALSSGVASGPETRISFAVNSHENMRRPCVEVSESGLKALFMKMLPHISGRFLVNDDYLLEYRQEIIKSLIRILDGIACAEDFMRTLSTEMENRIKKPVQ